MKAEDLTLEHEGRADLPETDGVTPAEAVLLKALDHASEVRGQFAIAVIISANQLDVMSSDGASHAMLADLFQSLSDQHARLADKPPEIITEH